MRNTYMGIIAAVAGAVLLSALPAAQGGGQANAGPKSPWK